MVHLQDNRIDQCLNDIQKYEKWGNLLAGQNRPPCLSSLRPYLRCNRLLPLATERMQEVLIVAPKAPIKREEYDLR